MARLLHLADPHQGLIGHSVPDQQTGIPSRLLDVARAWHHICEVAVERGVDVVVSAGDTFHVPNPDATSLNLFASGVRRLKEAGIPLLVIPGNHDRSPHPGRQAVMELFHDPPRVYVATRPEVVEVEGIRFACLPSVSHHQLMANRPGVSRAEGIRALTDGLVSILGAFREEKVSPDVLVGHWSVEGTVLDNGRDIGLIETEPILPMAELDGPWRYAAFGHIHRAQWEWVRDRGAMSTGRLEGPVFAYAGSIDCMSFGEEGVEKSVVEVDLDLLPGHSGLTFHPIPARRFVTLDLADREAVLGADVDGAIVRVRASVTEEQLAELDRAKVQRGLLGAGAHLVTFHVEVRRELRARAEQLTEATGPLDALMEFLRVRGIAEEEHPALVDLAKRLLEEVGE